MPVSFKSKDKHELVSAVIMYVYLYFLKCVLNDFSFVDFLYSNNCNHVRVSFSQRSNMGFPLILRLYVHYTHYLYLLLQYQVSLLVKVLFETLVSVLNVYHVACSCVLQKEASDSILSLINSHSDKIVLIGLYTLGKEDLLVEIANRLRTWIGVTEDRFERLKLLELTDVFRTSMEDCRVRVFPKYMIEKML